MTYMNSYSSYVGFGCEERNDTAKKAGLMNSIRDTKCGTLLIAGIFWLGFTAWAYSASLEELKSRLDLARENLRISEATEARIAGELERLRNSGNASAEVLNKYETYLGRARTMVKEDHEIVRELEAAYATHAPSRKPSGPPPPSQEGKMTGSEIPEEEALDELASLEREFNESLAAFDEMLLKEWDEMLKRSAKRMRDLSEEMAAAGSMSGREGGEAETSSGEKSLETAEGTGESGESEVDATEGTDAQETGAEQGESASKGEGKGETLTKKHPRHSDGHDDDIVARQLREAAEKETDPELKEKLWKEYEEYKKASSQ